jgi:DNA modification methylase
MTRLPHNQILVGDAATRLRQLPDASMDCVITSPPYFRLRNYQHPGQIGLEEHVGGWVESLRSVMREVARVLVPTGSLWLNLGDTYARSESDGALGKSLVLAPERVARMLLQEGWIVRNKVIWAKPNPMPTSVRDRLSCTYEVLYFAVRQRQYFFDLDAIRLPHRSGGKPQRRKPGGKPAWSVPKQWRAPLTGSNGGLDKLKASGLPGHPLGKNPGDVWPIPTAGFRGAHFATFPEALVRRPLLAGCPQAVCNGCSLPWRRSSTRQLEHLAVLNEFMPTCRCGGDFRSGRVLDPFIGSGTVAVVAEQLGLDWLGIDLNPEFVALAGERVERARRQRGQTDEEAAESTAAA